MAGCDLSRYRIMASYVLKREEEGSRIMEDGKEDIMG